MYSPSEENYLKAIFMLGRKTDKAVNTNQLSKRLNAKASSITDMVKKLSDKDLVDYEKYKGVSLTLTGERIALSILRKHRLWETFLVEKLHFSWDEVHEIAEQLEHIQSRELVNRLDEFLGFPEMDPHGDPIPDKNGRMIYRESQILSTLPVGTKVILVGLKDSSDAFLRYLDSRGLVLGDALEIQAEEVYDRSLQIKKANRIIILSEMAANNLLVKKIER